MRQSALPLLLVVLTAATTACAPPTDEEAAVGEQNLIVEDAPLDASSSLLLAGDPYIPVLDERPLVVQNDDTEPCLQSPNVRLSPGFTSVDASIVHSRSELDRSLELSVEGIPLARLGEGASASARIFSQTKFNASELNIFFAAKGTFTSELVSLGAEPPQFRADRVGRCGWGYIKRAEHKLKAIVMVTLSATDATSIAAIGCPTGSSETCVGTSLSIGPVSAKAALQSVLQRGSFNVSIRTDADNISGLPPLPLGAFATLSSTPESSADVLSRLTTALDWLGTAQTAIANHVLSLASADDTAKVAAPTSKVVFAHYPGVTSWQKAELAKKLDVLLAQRRAYADVVARDEAWNAFTLANREERGFFFNIPGNPAGSVDELVQREREARKIIIPQRDRVERELTRCQSLLRNDQRETSADRLVSSIVRGCTTPTSMPADFESTYGVKALAPTAMTVRPLSVLNDDEMCPRGQRMARKNEIALIKPLSYAAPKLAKDGGLWIKRDGSIDAPIWVKNGNIETFGLAFPPTGLGVCFDDANGLFVR